MGTVPVVLSLLRTPRVFASLLANRFSLFQNFRRAGAKGRKIKLVVLVVTQKCNMRCCMCMQDHNLHATDEENRLTIEEYEQLLTQVKRWAPLIQLTGGEPLLYAEIERLVKAVKNAGLFCMINTNGSFLAKYASRLVEAGVEKVTVSLDGPREIHDSIRQRPGAYDAALAGIRRLAEEKKRQKTNYPFIDIKTVLSPANIGRLEDVVRLYADGHVQMVDFIHLWFLHESQVQLHLDEGHQVDCYRPQPIRLFTSGETERLIRELRDLQKRYSKYGFIVFPPLSDQEIRAYYADPGKIVYRQRCVYPYQSLRVLPSGDVLACPEHLAAKAVLGNLREESITDIAYGWRADRFLKCLAAAQSAWPICRRCCGLFRS